MKKLLVFTVLLAGCATTPRGQLHQAAQIQKIAVDGLADTYLDVCEQVVMPQCIQKNEESKATSAPWTQEDRVACLRPCDSSTAQVIQTALDGVIAAQLVVLAALRSEDEGGLVEARSELEEAADRLLSVLKETGAEKLVKEKLFGG